MSSGIDLDLVERALRCGNEDLFPERSKLLQQRDACQRLVANPEAATR
jgi:hypothetical protein